MAQAEPALTNLRKLTFFISINSLSNFFLYSKLADIRYQ